MAGQGGGDGDGRAAMTRCGHFRQRHAAVAGWQPDLRLPPARDSDDWPYTRLRMLASRAVPRRHHGHLHGKGSSRRGLQLSTMLSQRAPARGELTSIRS